MSDERDRSDGLPDNDNNSMLAAGVGRTPDGLPPLRDVIATYELAQRKAWARISCSILI